MNVPDPLIRRLGRARPPDPEPREADQAAVRVLARVAILEAGLPATRPARWRRRVLTHAVAAGLAALILLAAPVPDGSRQRTVPETTAADGLAPGRLVVETDPLQRLAYDALGGDRLARSRLRNAGPRGRRLLLELAAEGGPTGTQALAMMRSFGAVRGRADIAQVARLAHQPELRHDAIWLLGSDVGTHGTRHLTALLVAEPAAEIEVVQALLRMAARGRRTAAASGLVAGARAGRVQAAAGLLSVRGAAGLAALLTVVPEPTLAAPAVLAVVRTGPRTLRTRLGFLAEEGNTRAMTLAAHARLPGIVAVLESAALGDDPALARRAVGQLALVASVDAHVALGRALDGPAAGAARQALQGVSQQALSALANAACTVPRHTQAALAALGAGGPEGLRRLASLATRPRLAVAVTRALGAGGGEADMDSLATELLVGLSDRSLTRLGVVAALAHRLRAGDESAGSGLLSLARAHLRRPALRALSECGPAGVRWLREAEREPSLARAASAWLTRIGAKSLRRPEGRGRGFAGLGKRVAGSHV